MVDVSKIFDYAWYVKNYLHAWVAAMSPFTKMLSFLTFGLLAVFAWHFATVFGWLGPTPLTQGEFFWRIGGILVGFLVASVLTAMRVASARGELATMPDEREEKVEVRAERLGVIILYAGLLLVCWFVFTPLTPIQVANALLAVVCVSELVKMSYALLLLKRRV